MQNLNLFYMKTDREFNSQMYVLHEKQKFQKKKKLVLPI